MSKLWINSNRNQFFPFQTINHKISSKPRLKIFATFPKTKQLSAIYFLVSAHLNSHRWQRNTDGLVELEYNQRTNPTQVFHAVFLFSIEFPLVTRAVILCVVYCIPHYLNDNDWAGFFFKFCSSKRLLWSVLPTVSDINIHPWYFSGYLASICQYLCKPQPVVQKTRVQQSRNQILPFRTFIRKYPSLNTASTQ